MKYYEHKLTDMLILHEGFRSKIYKCPAGKWTIGVGRNLEDRGITEDEGIHLLRNDIEISKRELSRNLSFFNSLHPVRQCVLVDMHINLGWPRLSQFKKTLTAIGRGKYKEASEEMLDSRWANQVGKRAQRLSRMMNTARFYDDNHDMI